MGDGWLTYFYTRAELPLGLGEDPRPRRGGRVATPTRSPTWPSCRSASSSSFEEADRRVRAFVDRVLRRRRRGASPRPTAPSAARRSSAPSSSPSTSTAGVEHIVLVPCDYALDQVERIATEVLPRCGHAGPCPSGRPPRVPRTPLPGSGVTAPLAARRLRRLGEAARAGRQAGTRRGRRRLVRDGDHVAIGGCLYSRTPHGAGARAPAPAAPASRSPATSCATRASCSWRPARPTGRHGWVGIGPAVGRVEGHARTTSRRGQATLRGVEPPGPRACASAPRAMGVPFLPTLTMLGSDLMGVGGMKTIDVPVHRRDAARGPGAASRTWR